MCFYCHSAESHDSKMSEDKDHHMDKQTRYVEVGFQTLEVTAIHILGPQVLKML